MQKNVLLILYIFLNLLPTDSEEKEEFDEEKEEFDEEATLDARLMRGPSRYQLGLCFFPSIP